MTQINKSSIIQLFGSSTFSKLSLPEGFENQGERQIVKTIQHGTLDVSFELKVADVYSTSSKQLDKTIRMRLSDMNFDEEDLKSLNGHTAAFLQNMKVVGWFHDAPFFIEVGSDRVIRSAKLIERLSPGTILSEIADDEENLLRPVFVTSLPAIFYDQIKTPSNSIEAALQEMNDQGQVHFSESMDEHFKDSEIIQEAINLFGGVDTNSLENTVAGSDKKDQPYCLVKDDSLIGFIAKTIPQNVFTFAGEQFDENGPYYMSLHRTKVKEAMNQALDLSHLLNSYSLCRLADIIFYIKCSQLKDNWIFNSQTRQIKCTNNGNIIHLDDTFNVRLRLEFTTAVAETVASSTAMATTTRGVWYRNVWPKKSVDAQGKPVVNQETKQKAKPFSHQLVGKTIDYEEEKEISRKRLNPSASCSIPSASSSDLYLAPLQDD